jgi:hypothetical protein
MSTVCCHTKFHQPKCINTAASTKYHQQGVFDKALEGNDIFKVSLN